ncbi:MAG: hypothetical protein WAL61_08565 [Acidimicrobiales bacterium]
MTMRPATGEDSRAAVPEVSVKTRSARFFPVVAILVYGIVAAVAYLPSFPGDPNHVPTCACGDLIQGAWFLRWTPFAIAHGLNPWSTNFIDYPSNVNLAQNTTYPLLGGISTPISLLFGPIASLTFLLWVSMVASASSMFLVLRQWVRMPAAAFFGGLVYGFSPYMVGQSFGHLNLLFVPIPPLILFALSELLVNQRSGARKWGLALGLLAAAQCFISAEVFVTTAIMSVIGIGVLAALYPSSVRQRVPHALRGFAWAALVCVPLVIYPLLYGALEVNGYVGSAHGTYPFQADLLGSLVPNGSFLVAPHGLVAIGNRFIAGDGVENGSYLGAPLLIVLIAICARWWRLGLVRFAALMTVAAWLLSLGPRLTIDTHETSLRLPFDVLEHLPGFVSLESARFSLYEDLFVAILLAVGMDQLGRWWTRNPAGHRGVSRGVAGMVLALVCAVVAVPLIPRWPHQEYTVSSPGFFSSSAALRIPKGSVTLTYPYPDNPNVQGMLWQATAGMRFRLMGGYAVVPGARRVASFDPFPPDLQMVPATLVGDYLGQAPGLVVPGSSRASAEEVRSFLKRYQVRTVIAQRVGVNPSAAYALIESALGTPPRHTGGVDVWFDVPADLRRAAASQG